jgi:excinuclease ABC subunit B
VEIMRDLRLGLFDVLIGVNLLREGLDLPEVSLVAILDADKEGFLRSQRSLTQTVGRAARHEKGKAIFYADRITNSMQLTMDDTDRKRSIQMKYNTDHNITPYANKKSKASILEQSSIIGNGYKAAEPDLALEVAEEEIKYLTEENKRKKISDIRRAMEKAAKDLNFLEAARLRDELKKFNK